jgi:hypothetical protein
MILGSGARGGATIEAGALEFSMGRETAQLGPARLGSGEALAGFPEGGASYRRFSASIVSRHRRSNDRV